VSEILRQLPPLALPVVMLVVWIAVMRALRWVQRTATRQGANPRIANYLGICARAAVSTALVIALMWWLEQNSGRGDLAQALDEIGLHFRLPLDQTLALGVAMAALCYVLSITFALLRRRLKLKVTAKTFDLFPQTPAETVIFALMVSPAAGISEEIIYRGFLQWMIADLTHDPISAVGTTAVIFGMLHLYQGGLGMIRTALIGLVFGIGTLTTGSLMPAILAHTLLDMTGTFVRVTSAPPAPVVRA
jgi:membrane protease YdiL (CAAX protease family)